MKKWIIPAILISFLGLSVISQAEAGDKSRHRWQGAAIGVASYLLLDQLFSHPSGTAYAQPTYVSPPPRVVYEYRYVQPVYSPCSPPGHSRRQYGQERHRMERGYWESVWIPGHYSRSGRYIDGHYERYYVED